IFGAKAISADEALEIGLVEDLSRSDALMETGVQLARAIAANGPVALRQAKTAMNHGMDMSMDNALMFERQCYKDTIPTEDRMEGLVAFREKRKPVYKGK
ncbi:MAG TPA: enoyl-CoA hydratase-related protein, partial [Bacillota bacterium]|nr:enoyl-CoA hydratase-related protein [Bacillota bacterium]